MAVMSKNTFGLDMSSVVGVDDFDESVTIGVTSKPGLTLATVDEPNSLPAKPTIEVKIIRWKPILAALMTRTSGGKLWFLPIEHDRELLSV